MKKTIVLLLIISIFFIVSCQATPEKDFVVNKNNILNSKSGTNLKAVNQRWLDSFSFFNDKLEIKIDASVYNNNSDWFIYEDEPLGFTQEEVDSFVKVLFGDNPIYDGNPPMTKDQIMETISSMNDTLKDMERNPQNYDSTIEDLKNSILNAEKEYLNAPNEIENSVISSKMKYNSDGGYSELNANATIDGNPTRLLVNSYVDNTILSSLYFDIAYKGLLYDDQFIATNTPNNINIKLTPEEAIDLIDEYIKKFGIKGYTCDAYRLGIIGDNVNNQCYFLYYTKSHDGINETFTTTKEASYELAFSPYDILRIGINDNGVQSIRWTGRSISQKKSDEKIELLSFEDIKDSFLNYAKAKYGYIQEDQSIVLEKGEHEPQEVETSIVCNINKIKLGYMRIFKKDAQGQYEIIPVWDFFGHLENRTLFGTGSFDSLITINAIDGSLIDRNKGY